MCVCGSSLSGSVAYHYDADCPTHWLSLPDSVQLCMIFEVWITVVIAMGLLLSFISYTVQLVCYSPPYRISLKCAFPRGVFCLHSGAAQLSVWLSFNNALGKWVTC